MDMFVIAMTVQLNRNFIALERRTTHSVNSRNKWQTIKREASEAIVHQANSMDF